MTQMMIRKTRDASRQWQRFFNEGDAAGCASLYEESAVMEAKPFGRFRGRAAIEAFWAKLIADGFADIAYIEPTIITDGADAAILSSGWRMNKARGVITKERWVLQSDGSVLLREDAFEAQASG